MLFGRAFHELDATAGLIKTQPANSVFWKSKVIFSAHLTLGICPCHYFFWETGMHNKLTFMNFIRKSSKSNPIFCPLKFPPHISLNIFLKYIFIHLPTPDLSSGSIPFKWGVNMYRAFDNAQNTQLRHKGSLRDRQHCFPVTTLRILHPSVTHRFY